MIFISLLIFISSFLAFKAQANQIVPVYFFWSAGCPHCAHAKPFLESLEQRYSQVKLYDFEVSSNQQNRDLFIAVGNKLKTDVGGVPFIVIGENTIIGYYNDVTTGREIERQVEFCLNIPCPDIVGQLAGINTGERQDNTNEQVAVKQTIPETLTLPLLGEIKTKHLSLPILTIIIAALDGFNPCAMWVLVFLIGLLLGMENTRRRWILGIAFIITSSVVYFLFMAAWLNLILFIGFIFWLRLIIGLVALTGGIYSLRQYILKQDKTCKVTSSDRRQRIFDKLRNITQQRKFFLALLGIILLAAAVNLVELICSAGFPVVYTQILALSSLARWQYYLYLLFYIFIFMLDDLLMFFVAMMTLQLSGIAGKYTRLSHLIGGILMLIVGLLLIFKPEWLMFG